jgi:hypothetical protein
MNWTTEYPAKPGYYWVRKCILRYPEGYEIQEKQIVVVEQTSFHASQLEDPVLYLEARFTKIDLDLEVGRIKSAEWQGPIEPDGEKGVGEK